MSVLRPPTISERIECIRMVRAAQRWVEYDSSNRQLSKHPLCTHRALTGDFECNRLFTTVNVAGPPQSMLVPKTGIPPQLCLLENRQDAKWGS